MKDYVTSKERLNNPRYKWITEDLKAGLVLLTMFMVFFYLATN